MAQLIVHSGGSLTDLGWISQQWRQPIQRIFWLHHVPSRSARGGHRHQSDCQMVLHCVVGSVSVYVQSPAQGQGHTYCLQDCDHYLFLDGSDWRLMYGFSSNAVLTVLASHSFKQTVYVNQPYWPVVDSVEETNRFVRLDQPPPTPDHFFG